MLIPELEKAGYEPIEVDDVQSGDLLVFWILPARKIPQHLAIKTEYGIIHTDARARRVVEIQYTGEWVERTVGAFRFPGVG